MGKLKAQKLFGKCIEYDRRSKKTWTPPNEPVQVMIRTPYKDENGKPFFYCPKAMRIAPSKMRNLCIPEGRRGAYFHVCRVLKWRFLDE